MSVFPDCQNILDASKDDINRWCVNLIGKWFLADIAKSDYFVDVIVNVAFVDDDGVSQVLSQSVIYDSPRSIYPSSLTSRNMRGRNSIPDRVLRNTE